MRTAAVPVQGLMDLLIDDLRVDREEETDAASKCGE
jgi:hypothetical protein